MKEKIEKDSPGKGIMKWGQCSRRGCPIASSSSSSHYLRILVFVIHKQGSLNKKVWGTHMIDYTWYTDCGLWCGNSKPPTRRILRFANSNWNTTFSEFLSVAMIYFVPLCPRNWLRSNQRLHFLALIEVKLCGTEVKLVIWEDEKQNRRRAHVPKELV